MKWYDIAHFFSGLATGLLNIVNPIIAFQGVFIFAGYEFLEQLRIRDKSYRDLFNYGLGWGVGLCLYLVSLYCCYL